MSFAGPQFSLPKVIVMPLRTFASRTGAMHMAAIGLFCLFVSTMAFLTSGKNSCKERGKSKETGCETGEGE